MTAFTLDRTCEKLFDRFQSGFFEAGIMGAAALLAVELVVRASPFLAPAQAQVPALRVFSIVIYFGLGAVFGFALPLAIMRHRKALESRLPERIVALRSAVFRNFFDMEDFNRWLQAADVKLDGKRPLDALGEEAGLQLMIDFVRSSRESPAATTVH